MNTPKLFPCLAVLALLIAVPAMAEVQIVAHSGVADATLGAGSIQKVFLGKQSQWSDGAVIKLGVLTDSPVTDEFLKNYVRKSASQFQTFWKKAIFSGTGNAPQEFNTAEALVAWVSATPGAVGFTETTAATDGCKIIIVQ